MIHVSKFFEFYGILWSFFSSAFPFVLAGTSSTAITWKGSGNEATEPLLCGSEWCDQALGDAGWKVFVRACSPNAHLCVPPPPQILVYSLEAERCVSKLGNALGDFSCVNLRDSPPNLMVSGNMDRR